jgi:hypothetical protein
MVLEGQPKTGKGFTGEGPQINPEAFRIVSGLAHRGRLGGRQGKAQGLPKGRL